MKRMRQSSRGVPLKAKILSSVCIAALLYGTVAQAIPDTGMPGGAAPLLHTDRISKRYSYDANGNHVGTESAAGSERKEYDILGRLIRYEGPNGTEKYTYIGAGPKRRTVKRTPGGGGAPELTTFLYDGDNVAAEYMGANPILSRTYVTPGLDENLSLAVHGGPDAGTYYYSQDGLGSVRTLTDAAGFVQNNYDYTAFGEPYNAFAAIDQRYGFTGREYSSLSGELCVRHRNYSLLAGRFDRRDPAGYDYNKFGNLYMYANNRPGHFIDPYGLWSSWAHRRLTQTAMDRTGCNVCTNQMIDANVGVDGGVGSAIWWMLDIGLFPDHTGAAPHYMAANGILGNSDRKTAKKRADDLINRLLKEAHQHARNGDCENGAIALGKALHTIQDKYSHTNAQGMPITNQEHKGLGTSIDKPQRNLTRHKGAQYETNEVVKKYVDILTKEGCYPCNK